ncbi:MAG: hypothetical protein KC621_07285 [Myxococcales bacterium]|nr:hypothetical protein [Myxococcales bacterium]
MEEPEPSLTKNLTGGGGCGCGCIGVMVSLAGGMLLGAIPLGMYLDSSEAPMGLAIALLVGGLLMSGLGVVVWVVSLFMD